MVLNKIEVCECGHNRCEHIPICCFEIEEKAICKCKKYKRRKLIQSSLKIENAKKKQIKQGKRDRALGKAFEVKVKADLEKKKWVVDRWSNNIDLIKTKNNSVVISGKLIPAKPKTRFSKSGIILMNAHTGFPDFVAFTKSNWYVIDWGSMRVYDKKESDFSSSCIIVGIEVKMTGKLDKEEKEKCNWLLANKIFNKILIASKGIKRGEIIYKEYGK